MERPTFCPTYVVLGIQAEGEFCWEFTILMYTTSFHELSSRNASPSPIQDLIGAQAVNLSSVGALAFLVYDILLTMDEEVQLVWSNSSRMRTKFLFTFVRYFPLLTEISILFVGTGIKYTHRQCYTWQVYQSVAAVLLLMAVDIILILRVHALYNEKKVIAVVLGVSFFAEIASASISLAMAVPGITFNDVCIVTSVPETLTLYGAASILFQGLLFGLTVFKFLVALREGWGNTPIVLLLMRDGTWAFILIFVVMLAEASLYGLKNHALAGVLYGWLISVLSFSGYRILLNIQHLSETDHRMKNITSSLVTSSAQFSTLVGPFHDPLSSEIEFELSPLRPVQASP